MPKNYSRPGMVGDSRIRFELLVLLFWNAIRPLLIYVIQKFRKIAVGNLFVATATNLFDILQRMPR